MRRFVHRHTFPIFCWQQLVRDASLSDQSGKVIVTVVDTVNMASLVSHFKIMIQNDQWSKWSMIKMIISRTTVNKEWKVKLTAKTWLVFGCDASTRHKYTCRRMSLSSTILSTNFTMWKINSPLLPTKIWAFQLKTSSNRNKSLKR